MVQPTRHKDVWANLYACTYEKFTATTSAHTTTGTFVVAVTPLKPTLTDSGYDINFKAYHRAYVNGVERVITSVVGSTKTYIIGATVAGDIVEFIYPSTEYAGIRIQQGLDFSDDAKTDDWEELGSSVVHTELISTKGTGSLKLLRNDKTELALIAGWKTADTYCLIAIKDSKSILAKTEYVLLLEVKFLGIKGGISVGGKWSEDYNFSFSPPIKTLAIT